LQFYDINAENDALRLKKVDNLSRSPVNLPQINKKNQIIIFFNLHPEDHGRFSYIGWSDAGGYNPVLIILGQHIAGKHKSCIKAEFVTAKYVGMESVSDH
jgi:hypothetical protein